MVGKDSKFLIQTILIQYNRKIYLHQIFICLFLIIMLKMYQKIIKFDLFNYILMPMNNFILYYILFNYLDYIYITNKNLKQNLYLRINKLIRAYY